MTTESAVVDYMKKVRLGLASGVPETEVDLNAGSAELDFIFGVGIQGITLFEKELFGKSPGDEVVLEVKPFQIGDLLGHLDPAVQNAVQLNPPCILKARVLTVDEPDQRELIQAIAGGTVSEGCGCGCGC